MNAFNIFYTEKARNKINSLIRKYREGICYECESAIAAAFTYSEKIVLDKLIKAIQEEISGQSIQHKGLIQNVMIKPVSDTCNLACTYCYEGKGNKRYGTSFMKTKTLEKIIAEAFEICGKELVFLWHGGEPTLAGLEFFRTALALQGIYNTRNVSVRNIIQTNGVNLREDLLNFFTENEFCIGISLDGPELINDLHRITHKHKGTFHQVTKTIRHLHAKNVQFGVITVLNHVHKGQAKPYYEFLINEGIKNVDVHPNFGHSCILPPKEFSDFVIELFDQWLISGGRNIRVNIFDEIFKVIYGESPATCYHAGTCGKIFAIEADGNIVPCTRPFDRSVFTFGNVTETSIGEIIGNEKYLDFVKLDKIAQSNSENCPWYSICHNGCPQHRLINGKQDIRGASIYCQCQSGMEGGNSAIWSHITFQTQKILQLN